MEYTLHNITSQQIEHEAQTLLEAMKSEENLRKDAAAAGIDLEEFDRQVRGDSSSLLTIEPKSAGVAPGVIEIVVIFAPLMATVLEDCWKCVILPRLKRRFGVDTIKEVTKN